MDRPLDPAVVRTQMLRRLAAGGTALSLGALASLWLPALVAPAVERDRLRTAVVERGPVDATVSASGLIVPDIERVITSPVDARVLRVIERAGAQLGPGQPILELDVSGARLAVDRLSHDLAIKQNAQAQTRLALEKNLIDLDSRAEIRRLQLASLEAQLERDRALLAEGLLSQEMIRRSELAAAQAAIELKQLEAERQHAHQVTRAQFDGLDLEIEKLRKEEVEAVRQLDLASPRADRAGILTWVITEEGITVTKGQILARVSDFSSFRVDASVSDIHARRLTTGQPVIVRTGDDRLDGRIAAVNPTVNNGVITVAVALADPSSPLLRSNLRVDVEIVTDRRADTLRVRRGPFVTGEGTQQVFVVRGDRAVREPVHFGVSSADHFEVTGGLQTGDEVVISDMQDYRRLAEVRLK